MRKHRFIAGIGIASALLLAAALPASARTTEVTRTQTITGARGEFQLVFKHIWVYDTACDDDSVSVQWKTVGGAVQTIPNNLGCGEFTVGPVPMGKGTTVLWQTCVDKSWPTKDLCYGWDKQVVLG
ncbi:hypothetical protein [Kribbella sp. NBC_00889]|uniref:hypothetical protein n=1 Tax=Kribbella sp. NBC_00889 TaxID=2975974 RepID=UPI003870DC4C|nr:hypothetical protein OG817_30055 [Kribbella sp. NBC_00889]